MKYAIAPNMWDEAREIIDAAGHRLVGLDEDPEFLLFTGTAADFPELPESVRFVQLPMAGIDAWKNAGVMTDRVRWANAAGLYADTVAESTLALMLALTQRLDISARTRRWDPDSVMEEKTWLHGDSEVGIIGAGGIGERLIELLVPFGGRITAVTRSGREVPGATESVAMSEAASVWSRADIFVLLAPLTDETFQIVDAEVLRAMKKSAILINVGRGPLVDTDALVDALRRGEIAAAGLDVVDPEPLPEDHPLWTLDNALITPHVANTQERIRSLIGHRAVESAAAVEAGRRMPAEVDIERGY